PKNRRRRRLFAKKKTKSCDMEWEWESQPAAASRRKQKRKPQDQVHQLHARINALESFLEKRKAADAAKLRMKQQNILPPPERRVARPARSRRDMAAGERRRYLAERNKNGQEAAALACGQDAPRTDRNSRRLNFSHVQITYTGIRLQKKKKHRQSWR